MSAKRFWLPILLCLLAGINSCNTSAPADLQPTGDDPGSLMLAQLPALPQSHEVSATEVLHVDGASTYDRSAGASDNGTALDLTGVDGTLEWAIWEFNPGYAFPTNLHVTFSVLTGGPAYIALSNFRDGIWEIIGECTATVDIPLGDARYISAAGRCYVAVLLWNGGNFTIDSCEITTVDGWQIITIDSAGDVGKYASLAVINGNPAIAYYMGGGVRYARATTLTGQQPEDWEFTYVDTIGNVGEACSLAVIAGTPAVAYADITNGWVKYARSSTPNGTGATDWSALLVDDSLIAHGTSLAEVDGHPAISYTGGTRLWYARASTITGESITDWSTLAVPGPLNTDSGSSLTVIAGFPAIHVGYWLGSETGLGMYCLSSTSTGASESDWSAVDGTGGGEVAPTVHSLAEINGHPAVAVFTDGMGSYMAYRRSTTPTGAAWLEWSEYALPSPEFYTGEYPSLAEINYLDSSPANRPGISHAYSLGDGPGLLFSTSSTESGAGDEVWTTVLVDDIEVQYTSLACVDHKPAIAYYDVTNGDLKYAIRMGP